jgi:hypothetical protein
MGLVVVYTVGIVVCSANSTYIFVVRSLFNVVFFVLLPSLALVLFYFRLPVVSKFDAALLVSTISLPLKSFFLYYAVLFTSS